MAALKQLADIFISKLPTVEELKSIYPEQPRPSPKMIVPSNTLQLQHAVPMQSRQPLLRVPL
eukprot:6366964-Ditylum_brightwellii.AAC.1